MNESLTTQLQHQQTGWEIIDSISAKIKVGMSEQEATDIANKTFQDFGITQMWHPLCIKFDQHTLKPGVKHRPTIETKLKHIAILDIGIVIDGFEVDCGLTIGLNEKTKKLAQASKTTFTKIKEEIEKNPNIAPKKIFERIQHHGNLLGKYTQIAPTAGHALGPFPTPKRNPKIALTEESPTLTKGGWMIEVHLSDGEFGAFYEDFVWIT